MASYFSCMAQKNENCLYSCFLISHSEAAERSGTRTTILPLLPRSFHKSGMRTDLSFLHWAYFPLPVSSGVRCQIICSHFGILKKAFLVCAAIKPCSFLNFWGTHYLNTCLSPGCLLALGLFSILLSFTFICLWGAKSVVGSLRFQSFCVPLSATIHPI